MPYNVSLSLYKAYLLPHLGYYSPLLIGINRTLNCKLESANKYALKTLLNLGNNLDYDTILSLSDMQSLEHRLRSDLVPEHGARERFLMGVVS